LVKVKSQFENIWDRYKELMFIDPYLPVDLLPRNWPAEKTRRMFNRLIKITQKLQAI
jgi:DNA-binding transcriptional regulator PaaX